MNDNAAPDRTSALAPSSPESEEAVLGSILINPDSYAEVADKLRFNHFFIVRNAWVFQAMGALVERGEAIDLLTLSEELRAAGRLKDIGGLAYLTYLVNNTPTHIHAVTYAAIVRRTSLRRQVMSLAQNMGNLALRDDIDEQTLIAECDQVFNETFARREEGQDTLSQQQVMSEMYDEVQWRYEHPDARIGVPTGFSELDQVLGGGPQRGDLVIVAARPGMGKTSLVMGMARHAADQGIPVGFFSLEMTPKQLAYRLAASEARINSQRFRYGNLDEREWQALTSALGTLSSLPIHYATAADTRQLAWKLRKMHRQHGLGMVVIDYLQLLVGGRAEHLTAEVGLATRQIKLLAQELDLPIYLLSQLNRKSDDRADKRPMLSELRQSGSIEQDADTVLFIYRDDYYNQNSDKPGIAEIIVAKQRNGPGQGKVELGWMDSVTRFYEVKKQSVNLR